MKRSQLEGMVFGRLTVIRFAGTDSGKKTHWLCRCECGQEVTVAGSKLKSGHTRSCGCLQREACSKHGYLVGQKRSPRTYRIWSNMIQRCTNPHADWYDRYGGRGITVCDRWLEFANFFADMGEAPPGMSIDRVENDKGYEPGNCKWATATEQSNNTSQVRKITFRGETLSLAQWCRRLGINYGTARCRLNQGYPLERVFSDEKHYSYGKSQARKGREADEG